MGICRRVQTPSRTRVWVTHTLCAFLHAPSFILRVLVLNELVNTSNPDEYELECAIKLLTTVGTRLETLDAARVREFFGKLKILVDGERTTGISNRTLYV